ncbi:MAG: ABC transporter ATP-binding protein [Chloroflexi bacterium]|nr:ABC transporter ATP-binding protein [Chloroflexota bacterium]
MRILWRLLGYLGRHRGFAAIGIGSLLLGLGLQLTVPLFIRQVIDHGILGGDVTVLLWSSLAVVGLTLLQSIFNYGRTYLLETLAQRVAYDMRNDIFRHLQRLSFSYYDQVQTGQIITKVLEDTSVIRQFFSMAIRSVLITSLLLVGVSAVLFVLDWRLALASLAVMPVIAVLAVVMGVKLRPLFRQVQDRFGIVTGLMQENLSGVRVVRAFAREPYEMERFTDAAQRFNQANMVVIRIWAFRNGLLHFLSLLSMVAVLLYGGWLAIIGLTTVGTLVAFSRYLAILAEPLQNLGMIVNIIARTMASGERIYDILDVKPEIVSRGGARDVSDMHGHVRFEHVDFSYQRGQPVLTDITLDAPPGSVVALFGPTGAGKSTLTALLPRFYDVTAGRVLIDGHDVRELELDSLRRNIGIVLQETLLFSATVRENIAFGRPDATEEEIIRAARAAQAESFIMDLPDGLDAMIGERGVNLSGGQKQRLAIARALLINPRILILDDATASVDTETEHEIQLALKELMRGRTTFVIAQRLLTLKQADEIIVLDGGRIVQRGTHAELVETTGLYHHIYELQLRDQEQVLLTP